MEVAHEQVQLNVRIPRSIKEQGDATLSMVGSSPVKVIRKLWEKLAQGGKAYEQIFQVLCEEPSDSEAEHVAPSPIERSSHLFEELGFSLGLDIASFSPSTEMDDEVMEQIEWDQLVQRGLA